jgi:hypothetical protein
VHQARPHEAEFLDATRDSSASFGHRRRRVVELGNELSDYGVVPRRAWNHVLIVALQQCTICVETVPTSRL